LIVTMRSDMTARFQGQALQTAGDVDRQNRDGGSEQPRDHEPYPSFRHADEIESALKERKEPGSNAWNERVEAAKRVGWVESVFSWAKVHDNACEARSTDRELGEGFECAGSDHSRPPVARRIGVQLHRTTPTGAPGSQNRTPGRYQIRRRRAAGQPLKFLVGRRST
jgi:hypothetical protein